MRRGWSAVLVALCVLGMSLGLVPRIEGTFALLTARTTNPNALFAATSLYAPGSLQASPSGRNGALSWSAGQNGSGYKVLGLGNGTSSTCPGSASPSYTTIGTATTLAYTDLNRSPAGVPQGTWYCYQVQTTYQLWSSIQNNPVAGAQVGVVATGVQYANVNANKLDTGDQFIFTFNQAIDPTTGPTSGNTICSNSTTIWVGSTTATGNCATTESVAVGKITGGTLDANTRWAATYAWSNGNRTMTVTLGSRVSGNRSPTISTATWTFTPTTNSAKLLSSSGLYHICDSNTGGGNCTPVFTTGAGSPFTGDQAVSTATATATATPAKTLTATSTSVRTSTATREPAPTSTATSTPRPVAPTSLPATATPTKSVAAPSPTAAMTSTSQSTPTATPIRTAISTSTATTTAVSTSTPTGTTTATSTVTSTKTMTASPMPTHTAQPTQTASTASTKAVIHSTQTVATATGSPSPSPTQPEATFTPTSTPPMPSRKTAPDGQPLPEGK
ncbi:MAG TPA: hypothetical protein VGE45_12645 [Chloroflexia bacterium]